MPTDPSATTRRSLTLLAYIAVLLLGCSTNKWQTKPAAPPAPVEQKSSLESQRDKAEVARGSADEALAYAQGVAEHLSAGESPNAEADPGLALDLLDAALQANPLRGAEIDYARGNIEFALQDYEVALSTYETNARKRGHAESATAVVRYHAAAGDREALTTFCNDTFALIRGGDAKNEFITECVAGMGYASPAEWELMSGPAVDEYERWRASRTDAQRNADAEKAAAERERQRAAAAEQEAAKDKRNCVLHCAEKESLCKSDCTTDQCRDDCSDAEWACRRQC